MLNNFKKIKNIGRFYDVSIESTGTCAATFKKFNLIYADNGTGKSTISTILKSLWKNEPQRLIEKQTINATGESFVELNVDNETYKFENGIWNGTPQIALEIFDEEFVEKNVFSLSKVETENRRELFNYTVLGDTNVAKVKKIDALNKHLREGLKDAIENAENSLKEAAGIPNIVILDKTVPLDDVALEAMQNRVNHNKKIINQEERIKSETALNKITGFEYIPYGESISADLSSLSFDAEYRAHIQEHNLWIKGGMNIVQNGDKSSCPFCFQNIEGNRPIATYKTLFSKEYEDLRDKVVNQIDSAERIYSDAVIGNVINLIARNNERCVFWHSLDKEIPESVALAVSLAKATQTFKNTLKALLERKKGNLLDAIVPNEPEKQGLGQEAQFRQAIANYNTSIDRINTKIQIIKDASQDIKGLKHRNHIEGTAVACNNVRFRNKTTSSLYEELEQYRQERKAAQDTIKRLRGEIDKESEIILNKYQDSINRELDNFNVDFSIQGVQRKADTASKDGVYFNILLKNKSFEPNGSAEHPYRLSNTLSSGDKSTLAFAFFIAKYREKDLRNQILVFDDPITSLDFFRKTQTQNTIRQFANNAAQVIVLTHSIEFAKLFKSIRANDSHFVDITQNSLASGLSYIPHNTFSDMGIDKHSYNYKLITQYITEPASVERISVMRSIRPYVETTLKKYRRDFASLTLGGMIRDLKREENICEDYIQNLEIINDTVTPESAHGSDNVDANDYEHISDIELMGICKRAINISAPPLRR